MVARKRATAPEGARKRAGVKKPRNVNKYGGISSPLLVRMMLEAGALKITSKDEVNTMLSEYIRTEVEKLTTAACRVAECNKHKTLTGNDVHLASRIINYGTVYFSSEGTKNKD
jgi:histone H3/H4